MENTKDILKLFADDERSFNAVRDELMETELEIPDTELSNEDLGAEVRARIRAKELVKIGFDKIKQLKTNKKIINTGNPAR